MTTTDTNAPAAETTDPIALLRASLLADIAADKISDFTEALEAHLAAARVLGHDVMDGVASILTTQKWGEEDVVRLCHPSAGDALSRFLAQARAAAAEEHGDILEIDIDDAAFNAMLADVAGTDGCTVAELAQLADDDDADLDAEDAAAPPAPYAPTPARPRDAARAERRAASAARSGLRRFLPARLRSGAITARVSR